MPWRWDDLIIPGEHWLYDAHERVLVIVCGANDHWKIRYPVTHFLLQTTTLDAARKLAVNVAFWTWPISGPSSQNTSRPKITEAEWKKRDLADEKYVADDTERLRRELEL